MMEDERKLLNLFSRLSEHDSDCTRLVNYNIEVGDQTELDCFCGAHRFKYRFLDPLRRRLVMKSRTKKTED